MKIRHQHTTPCYPQCNGLNERFNGELVQILSKVIEHQGKNWDLELPSALWAYRTSVKTGTGFTPFHLVYGKEALFPVEVELPAVKMLEKLLGQSSDAFKERLLQLQEVQLDRMSALEHYGQMQEKALEKINEKVKSKGIKKHDLVLHYNSKLDKTFQKKFQIKWEGPFKVLECFSNGTYQLAILDGVLHKSRVNGLRLKLYHARLMMVEQDELFAEQGKPKSQKLSKSQGKGVSKEDSPDPIPEDMKITPWRQLQGIRERSLIIAILSRVKGESISLEQMGTKFERQKNMLDMQRIMIEKLNCSNWDEVVQYHPDSSKPHVLEKYMLLFINTNKDPRVAIKQIPLDFEQFLSRCRLERQRRQQPQSFEITLGLSIYVSDNVDEFPFHWCVHEGRVEEMSTFVTPRSYTIAIADAPYGFCA
ncbi:hypothetical protein L7F22_048769 [Adiantum nelumboides]|nr:hypothetical protein [Adiantum nelumboides]